MKSLDLTALEGEAGVFVEDAPRLTPDEGVLETYEMATPDFGAACYYAACQKYDATAAGALAWPAGANRIQPLRVEDFRDLTPGGIFLLILQADGRTLALLPIAGPRAFGWFTSEGERLVLNLGTLGTDEVEGPLPTLAWARSADPYRACADVWRMALSQPEVGWSTRPREEKTYPHLFRYLGWCSWEEYKGEIGESVLIDALADIEESDTPVRYALVDDGHLTFDDKRRLTGFAPNDKFPAGWAPLMAREGGEKIRWMGLWLNFNGYWGGLGKENDFGGLNEHLREVPTDCLQPKEDYLSNVAFYEEMIGRARAAGFDFVKVDDQSRKLAHYRGTETPVAAAARAGQALEGACARHMDGLINCMAHNSVCVFNTRVSAVTRCSEDYKVGDLGRARRHLHNSYGNIPWIGQTVWGDHDMFHSNDPVSGAAMARSKALSGGPIYLSDNPSAFDAANIRPLCFADGELLRPLAPAAPLPESLYLDPFAGGAAYRAVAPLPGRAAAVVAYNLTEPEQAVEAAVAPGDYAAAGAMMQPYAGPWEAPGEGLVAYDWLAGEARRLDGAWTRTIEGFGDWLVLLCPVRAGWAVIGRADKYLSPAAVEVIAATEDELILRLREGGPLTLWSERAAPRWVGEGDGGEDAGGGFEEIGAGLWRREAGAGRRDVVGRVRRG